VLPRPCLDCGTPVTQGSRCRRHTKRNGSTRSWRKVRAFVLARDRYRCQIAGCWQPADHVDHITPLVADGLSELWNLRSTCARHNLQKGAQSG
jgi:5-methylcytosine-specific restriction endonuclease McrA